jgi:hypothetical protein
MEPPQNPGGIIPLVGRSADTGPRLLGPATGQDLDPLWHTVTRSLAGQVQELGLAAERSVEVAEAVKCLTGGHRLAVPPSQQHDHRVAADFLVLHVEDSEQQPAAILEPEQEVLTGLQVGGLPPAPLDSHRRPLGGKQPASQTQQSGPTPLAKRHAGRSQLARSAPDSIMSSALTFTRSSSRPSRDWVAARPSQKAKW